MISDENQITLSSESKYEIRILGYLDDNYSDWNQEIRISTEASGESLPVTTLYCVVDQAGLLGILRRLYTLGLPLISVLWTGD